jgi:putative intracellular protease/amidase
MARFYETGRIVSTVCHGATGLLNVNLSNGEPLIKGKKVTGFSWPEEIVAKRDDAVPFNLEEEMKKIGADYSKADKPWGAHVIEDGRLITGQNPSSARGVAEAVIKRLKT